MSDLVLVLSKHNTLAFNGEFGMKAKEYLIKLCMPSDLGIVENIEQNQCGCVDFSEGLENLNLDIEILKSRVDFLLSLMT